MLQKRSTEKEGYSALRLGFGDIGSQDLPRPRLVSFARRTRAEVGFFKKANLPVKRFIRELRVSHEVAAGANVGDQITVSVFKSGEKVDVSGISKGRGFAGVFKRHHMAGHVEAHGAHEYFRHPGSIGQQQKTPARSGKTKRLARAHMGVDKVTIQNLKVVEVVPEKNLLLVQGAVPGASGGLLVIRLAVKAARA